MSHPPTLTVTLNEPSVTVVSYSTCGGLNFRSVEPNREKSPKKINDFRDLFILSQPTSSRLNTFPEEEILEDALARTQKRLLALQFTDNHEEKYITEK